MRRTEKRNAQNLNLAAKTKREKAAAKTKRKWLKCNFIFGENKQAVAYDAACFYLSNSRRV